MEIPFLGKFGPKHQNSHFKLKFGTYSNSSMQNSMVMFILSVFDWKYPFWANLVQKIKIISWSWNLVTRLIRICRIHWCCSFFFSFWVEIPFLGKFGPKNRNCHFKMKFRPCTNSNIENSMVMFIFCFWSEILFRDKFGPKNQNCHFKLKFGYLH